MRAALALLLVGCATATPVPARRAAPATQPTSPPVVTAAAPVRPCYEVSKGPVVRNGSGKTISGHVKAKRSGAGMAGVTVVATGPAQGTMADLTDGSGNYLITGLPPGRYAVTFYYAESKLEAPDVDVGSDYGTTLDQAIDTGTAAATETISIKMNQCFELHTNCPDDRWVDKDYIKNVPAIPCR